LVAVGKRYGYINDSGTFAINPQFDEGGNFGRASHRFGSATVEGYINKHGKYVWNPVS